MKLIFGYASEITIVYMLSCSLDIYVEVDTEYVDEKKHFYPLNYNESCWDTPQFKGGSITLWIIVKCNKYVLQCRHGATTQFN